MPPAPRPPTKDPWEDPSLNVERESRAAHRRRKDKEAHAGADDAEDEEA